MAELIPWAINDLSTEASVARRATASLLGSPLGSFAGGISATTAGGGHGVIGDGDLAVSQHAGTPGMSVDVAIGSAFIRGTEAADQGVYTAVSSSVVQVTVTAADVTNPRKDLVVARIYDEEYSGVDKEFALEVIAGTPAGSPADPTVPDNCLVLARVAVAAAASSIVNANITDLRTFATGVGGLHRCTAATRPTTVSLYEGLKIYEVDTGLVQQYDGAAWTPLWTLVGSSVYRLQSPTVVRATDVVYTGNITGAATIDAANGGTQILTLTGNVSSITISNLDSGGSLDIILIQDGTGGRTIAWPAAWYWPTSEAAATAGMSTAIGATSFLSLKRAGSLYYAFLGLNLAT